MRGVTAATRASSLLTSEAARRRGASACVGRDASTADDAVLNAAASRDGSASAAATSVTATAEKRESTASRAAPSCDSPPSSASHVLGTAAAAAAAASSCVFGGAGATLPDWRGAASAAARACAHLRLRAFCSFASFARCFATSFGTGAVAGADMLAQTAGSESGARRQGEARVRSSLQRDSTQQRRGAPVALIH